MRRRCISNLINSFHCSINRSIEADCIISTWNIKVYCTGKTDCIDSMLAQSLCSSVWSVSTDDNHTINSILSADLRSLSLTFLCSEFFTSGCTKDCTASLNYIRNTVGIHRNYFIIKQSHVSLLNADNLDAIRYSLTNNSSYSSIHSRCITTACKHTNLLNLFSHNILHLTVLISIISVTLADMIRTISVVIIVINISTLGNIYAFGVIDNCGFFYAFGVLMCFTMICAEIRLEFEVCGNAGCLFW